MTPSRVSGSVADEVEFDPLSPEHAGNPYPLLLKLQHDAPIFYIPRVNMWCVTGYEDVMEIIRDVETFSSQAVIPNDLHPDIESMFPDGSPQKHLIVNADPPQHTRLRKAMQPAFTPRAISARDPMVRELATRLIDQFVDRGSCDIVSEFSKILPLQVVILICGLPLERADEFGSLKIDQLSEVQTPNLDPTERMAMATRIRSFVDYLNEFIDERREHPVDDITSAAIHSPARPPLQNHEIISVLLNVIGAGVVTTANAIPLMLRELLRHQDQWRATCENPDLVDQIVEESLRFVNPVRGVVRITTRPVTVCGQDLPEGASIYLHYGAAQRDPRIFAAADKYEPARGDVSRHYAFGRGVHMCLGAPLARLEMQVSLKCFIERLPGLRLVDDTGGEWIPDLISPDLVSLPVAWDVAARTDAAG
jgi:cytochrome P450